MFKIIQNPLRFTLKAGFLLLIFFTTEVKAQFDTNIFTRRAPFTPESVLCMGDQNSDGYDDFLLLELDSNRGSQGKACLFYGGNPILTFPSVKFPFETSRSVISCDVNRDGKRDIILQRKGSYYPPILDIYYGGSDIDTIVDLSFTWHDSLIKYIEFWFDYFDFNGDGFSELFLVTGKTSLYSSYGIKSLYIIKTEPPLNLNNYSLIQFYPDTSYQVPSLVYSSADLNGDGKTDFSFYLNKKYAPADSPSVKRRIYYGNENFDFSQYYEITDTFYHIEGMHLMKDLNNDGKGELIFSNQGGTYPEWFTDVLSKGSRPPDFIPEEGINTQYAIWAKGFSPGDVNGDGYNDYIRPYPHSTMFLYLGGDPMADEKVMAYGTSSSFYNLNFGGRVGDVDGDGIDDICIGENGYYEHLVSSPPGNLYIIKGTRTSTSVKEVTSDAPTAELAVKISPNPTGSIANLTYSLPFAGELRLDIHDITGQRIYTNTLMREMGENTELLDLTRLVKSSGIYFITLELRNEGETISKSLKLQYMK